MRPTPQLLAVLTAGLLISIGLGLARVLGENPPGWIDGFGSLLLLSVIAVALLDLLVSWRAPRIRIRRVVAPSLPVSKQVTVSLVIENEEERSLHLSVMECAGPELSLSGLPASFVCEPTETITVKYGLQALKRGDLRLDGLHVRVRSRWGWFQVRHRMLGPMTLKVYPDFAAVTQLESLMHHQHSEAMGIHTRQQRGEGLDFRQLRDFRPSDSLRQVDWKATSRLFKPISREFQEERDQTVLFVLDCSRRMRSRDGELSYFDHCLNAFLLNAWTALRQGDGVGFLTFGGESQWFPPVRKQGALKTLLDGVYGLHSGLATSDYLGMAQVLLERHRKRSLVVVISSPDAEEQEDVMAAHQLLSESHLVLFAALQDAGLTSLVDTPAHTFSDALTFSSAMGQAVSRQRLLDHLRCSGAVVLDEAPTHLHVALLNTYLALKRSGRF